MLLHLDASARRSSFSRRLSKAYADAWRAAHPGAGYVYRDLAADPVPHIGEAWTELCDHVLENEITDIARYEEAATTPARRAAWAIVKPLLDEVVAADVVLIGTPMYNFSIPSSLKAWIDQITFPKMSLKGRSFVVTGARGGAYGPGTPREPYDHEERYLRDFFKGHFAVEDVTFVHAELVNARLDPALFHLRDRHEESLAAALETASSLGSALASPSSGAEIRS
ncbi:FMN-dependent NADH-azoreductase [Nonomuraea roseoviolacea]|uniref:FMN dependent NADH:quinone oxidoreductase n=1 Tax=Nonomuraea roseoviolacea subsp. carminata TaxID=160689 RepID=A0ABT1JYP9_9ACTN|nr:NAD(P)H-dependent oxidoreductase [Nonomuraea roseoviolacea]MCP2346524.1 FMN-dependent NADH-azoreductase [Nonomuraea roseoviolacea subsp. carminata]